MTQSFDARRWWLLVGKHWSENRKKYTLSLIAMAGLLLLWFSFTMITDRRRIDTELQIVTFYSGLFIVGCLYASTLFAELGSKTRGLNYLVVPASHLEKLLCTLFYGVIVFFVCYTVIFYMIDIIAVKAGNAMEYAQWIKGHKAGDVFVGEKIYNVFNSPDNHGDQPGFTYYLLLFYFVLQAAFLCGSVYFAKFSFIKSVITMILAGLFVAFFLGKVVMHILPSGRYNSSLTSYEVFTEKQLPSGDGIMIYSDDATDKLVSIPAWIGDVLLFLLKYAFAPLLWLATYYRLKEKEI